MHILRIIFGSIYIALMVISSPILLWQFIIGLFGLLPMKNKNSVVNKNHHFAIVICARNEEAVIGCLIDSLIAQDYPRDKFDVFVAADNCTDNTASEARKYGAYVYERFDSQYVGKGYALQWIFKQIESDFPDVYDAVTVFDADNLADPGFLRETNKALCAGADVVKGYRQVKNLGDSWVSDCYAIYWLTMMRFFHRARANCGLSCFVDGTGFSFKTELIHNGWNTFTMVEDCEFSMQQICKGYRIVPAYNAVYYDEQPVTFSVSLYQRFRWTVGCVQCIHYCLPAALESVSVKSGNKIHDFQLKFGSIDVIAYMLLIPAVAMNLIGGFFGFATIFVWHPHILSISFYYIISFLSLAWNWLSLSASAIFVLFLEKYRIRLFLRAILLFPLFIFSSACMAIIAIIWPKTAWKPITHNRRTNIKDLAIEQKPGSTKCN